MSRKALILVVGMMVVFTIAFACIVGPIVVCWAWQAFGLMVLVSALAGGVARARRAR